MVLTGAGRNSGEWPIGTLNRVKSIVRTRTGETARNAGQGSSAGRAAARTTAGKVNVEKVNAEPD
jgi:hypothetical protein